MCLGMFYCLRRALTIDLSKKKLRNTTGRNTTWGVLKAYVVFFITIRTCHRDFKVPPIFGNSPTSTLPTNYFSQTFQETIKDAHYRAGSEKMKPFYDVILHFCFQPPTPPVSKVQE